MTRILTDGFESQASGIYRTMDSDWSYQTGTWQTIDPYSGSYMLACNVNDAAWHTFEKRIGFPFNRGVDVLYLRIRAICNDPNTSEFRIRWGDVSAGEWGSFILDASGDNHGDVAWGSLSAAIPLDDLNWLADTWYLIELKLEHDIGSSQSRITIEVDAEEVYTASGAYGISWDGIDRAEIGRNGESSAAAWAIDDLAIQNDDGSVNNSWMGDTRIVRAYPDAVGAYEELLHSDGEPTDNYTAVDEAPPVDTDYIYGISGGSLGADTYGHSALSVPSNIEIKNVVVHARGKTGMAGEGVWQGQVYISALYSGGSIPMQPRWEHEQWVWDENPDTSAAWTTAEVDAAEFGFGLTE